jgi:hypothetical protein
MANRHGYEWRILARCDDGTDIALASPENETRTAEACSKLLIPYQKQPSTPPNTYFDELVIDDWFHLERMDDDTWWMRVGDKRIWVRLDESDNANVSIENDVYPE